MMSYFLSAGVFVQASKKKVYMLYNLQPDRSVTGGAWYSDQDFESEFVEVLNQQCFKFLQSKVQKTLFKLFHCPNGAQQEEAEQRSEAGIGRGGLLSCLRAV